MDWPALLENQRLIDAAASLDRFDDPAAVARLRRYGDASMVRQVIDLVRARRKASGKLDHADRLVADAEAVEQATGSAIAAAKARRFVGAGADAVVDLCCGIGGDAMQLAQHLPTMLIDHDPDRAWAARHNVQLAEGMLIGAAAADVTSLRLADRWFHIDPARRAEGRRFHRYDQMTPGPAVIEPIIAATRGGAVKLSPGVDVESLPPGEVQFISERGKLTQAVLWTGRLAEGACSAMALPSGAVLRGEATPAPVARKLGAYLLAVDPAVERADLMGQLADRLDAPAVHPKLGLLTRDEPGDDPFVTCFERLETMPFRQRRLADWLKAHDAGEVEVKTRGKAVDPDRLAPRLKGGGSTRYTVFVLRHEQRLLAHITRRCVAPRP